jgi:hypothetical protein
MVQNVQWVGDAQPVRWRMVAPPGAYTEIMYAVRPPLNCWYHTPTWNVWPRVTRAGGAEMSTTSGTAAVCVAALAGAATAAAAGTARAVMVAAAMSPRLSDSSAR